MFQIRKGRRLPKTPEVNVIYDIPEKRSRKLPRIKLHEPSPGNYEWGNTQTRTQMREILKNYFERTDRNDGCLGRDIEQLVLYFAKVAVIGLGGMGGYQSSHFVQLGIGDLCVADIGTFDLSNINRQFGANLKTLNENKAISTARILMDLADDFRLRVCPAGLNEETADLLIKGRDVVVDMIEFWALADRIWLHRTCQHYGIVVINCNSIVHSSFGMRFDYRTAPTKKQLGGYATVLERQMQMTYERARELQTKYEEKTITIAEKTELMEAVYSVFIPEETEYMRDERYSTRRAMRRRLMEEGRVPVISVNPPFAAGWCATEVYFQIIEQCSPLERDVMPVAIFPEVTKVDLGKKTITTFRLPIRPRLKLSRV